MKEKTKNKEIQYIKFMYIGPNINGRLKQNLILKGSLEQIKKEFEQEISKCKLIVSLIVPVHKISQAKLNISDKNSVFHKYYNDILSTRGGI